jgi:hypothetical protein
MSKKLVFDIDKALLNQRPHVMFKGTLYPVRDMTMAERMKYMMVIYQRQQEIENNAVESGAEATTFEALQPLIGEVVCAALEGVPEEVAQATTELEFAALNEVMEQVRKMGVTVEAETVEDPT